MLLYPILVASMLRSSRWAARRARHAVLVLTGLILFQVPMATMASAGTLATGLAFAPADGQAPFAFGCDVVNVGRAPASITVARVLDGAGSDRTDFQGCTSAPLQPGASCGFSALVASLVPGPTYAARAELSASGNGRSLRALCRYVTVPPVLSLGAPIEMR